MLAKALKTLKNWTNLGLVVLIFSFGIALTACAKDDDGPDMLRLTANGMEIKVFTYRPPDCQNPSILFVFHGMKRNAEEYRDRAIKTAHKACLMVFAPKFDKDRFPNWRYQRGGVMHKGEVQDHDQWTASIVRELIKSARQEVKNEQAKVYLFGHSAGAQFLSRIAAYTPLSEVHRIVIANPSTYVAPLLDEDAPYGFGGALFSEFQAHETLKAYLASPITIYLGQEDTGRKNLVRNEAAKRQGENRLERGRAIFRQAQEVAQKRNWPFNWQLVEVPGVGHSSRRMLRASEFYHALDLESEIPIPAAVGS